MRETEVYSYDEETYGYIEFLIQELNWCERKYQINDTIRVQKGIPDYEPFPVTGYGNFVTEQMECFCSDNCGPESYLSDFFDEKRLERKLEIAIQQIISSEQKMNHSRYTVFDSREAIFRVTKVSENGEIINGEFEDLHEEGEHKNESK